MARWAGLPRETSAKLSSLKALPWIGVALFIFGLASLFWPPLRAIIASTTTSIAIAIGGLALILLPTVLVGNELLILGAVALTVGAWFLAHRRTHRRPHQRALRPQRVPEQFEKCIHAECIDEEQWLQEYCCIPADENTAFITHDMISACEEPNCLRDIAYLRATQNPLFLGIDFARKKHLCVMDVGEKIDDVLWDRLRLEFRNVHCADPRHPRGPHLLAHQRHLPAVRYHRCPPRRPRHPRQIHPLHPMTSSPLNQNPLAP